MLISDAKAKKTSGGYARIFDDAKAGSVFSRVHATNIRNGNELEKIVAESAKHVPNDDLDAFIANAQQDGTYLCTKKAYKQSSIAVPHHEPDALILTVSNGKRSCLIVELKDGDDFDMKKSDGERDTLVTCHTAIATSLPSYRVSYRVCCFNQDDKREIVDGLKHRFDINHVMTGRELCDMLDIDYDAIRQRRTCDAIKNRQELVRELMSIDWFRELAEDALRKG